jgi:hypothetical protein
MSEGVFLVRKRTPKLSLVEDFIDGGESSQLSESI